VDRIFDLIGVKRPTRSYERLQSLCCGGAIVPRDWEAANRIKYIKSTIETTPSLAPAIREEARALEVRLMDLQEQITGDPTKSRRSEPAMPSMLSRINSIVYGHWSTTYGPTETHKRNYDITAELFEDILDDLRQVIEVDLVSLENKLEDAGAPWTPGRGVPDWKR